MRGGRLEICCMRHTSRRHVLMKNKCQTKQALQETVWSLKNARVWKMQESCMLVFLWHGMQKILTFSDPNFDSYIDETERWATCPLSWHLHVWWDNHTADEILWDNNTWFILTATYLMRLRDNIQSVLTVAELMRWRDYNHVIWLL